MSHRLSVVMVSFALLELFVYRVAELLILYFLAHCTYDVGLPRF